MSYIDTTTGEIIDVPRVRKAQAKTVKTYRVRKSVLGLSTFQIRAIKNIAPIVIAGMLLAITLMGISR